MIRRNLVLSTLTAALIGLSSAAGAVPQNFISPDQTANGTVAAHALFTPSAGSLQIVLTNDLLNQISSGQAISDLHWTINGISAAVTGTTPQCGNPLGPCTLAAGNYVNINVGGGGSTVAGTDLDRWGITNTGSVYNLTTLTGTQPTGLIWADSQANANAGADNFNPYVDHTATFTLAIAGLTANSVISDVTFTFGTNGAVAIPIPAAVWLFGSGLMGLVAIARRRQGSLMRGSPALA